WSSDVCSSDLKSARKKKMFFIIRESSLSLGKTQDISGRNFQLVVSGIFSPAPMVGLNSKVSFSCPDEFVWTSLKFWAWVPKWSCHPSMLSGPFICPQQEKLSNMVKKVKVFI